MDHDHRLTFGLIWNHHTNTKLLLTHNASGPAKQFLKNSQKIPKNQKFSKFLKIWTQWTTIIVSHSVLWNHHQHYNGFHPLNVGLDSKFFKFQFFLYLKRISKRRERRRRSSRFSSFERFSFCKFHHLKGLSVYVMCGS